MPRVFIKGGVWKNTEDEVLKAAVMKYGPNQWARVASLLHRKSAKQCKRRWYEWLDPNIKKTEWSREEEEKLLHLAKLMPTQWRTIAPIIGRTPMQCLEHYEQLLDQAQAGDEDEPSAASDARRLRPGEIDPNPHTRPARPDPIDMDEDEKEMLSEARARLANTQGKKAKRKARERQMDEAKRLARLAKFRELRAAGIGVGRRKMRGRNVDYNHEIPFQKLPAPGFFDPGEDETVQPKRRARTRQDVEGKPRQQVEKEDRKEAKAKLEELKKTDMPAALRKINRLAGKEEPMSKRSKLALPMPQVSDEDLEDLVKLGKTGADALATASQGNASSALLQDYNETPRGAQTARTPRAPAAQDNILTEAQNILALNQTNSVLEGGENTPLHAQGGSFSGVTPQRQALATPNRVLSTPFRGSSVVATPGRTPDTSGQTPMRDGLGINVESDSSLMTPRTEGERARHSDLRSQLRHGLASLPKPAGEYDIVVPDVEDVAEPTAQDIEDASDADRRRNAILRAKRIAELKRQSQAIQRDLPVPTEANDAILRKGEPKNEIQAADEMVKREMLAMIQHDLGIKSLKLLSQEDKDQAEALLNDEIASVKAEKKYDERKFFSVYESLRKDVAFDPSANAFGRVSLQSNKDVIAACEIELKSLRTAMGQENKKAVKLEKKLKLALGGYQKRAAGIRLCMKQAVEAEESAVLERKSFERLRLFELQAAPVRVNSMKEQLASQEKRQSELQQRYKGLRQQLESLS